MIKLYMRRIRPLTVTIAVVIAPGAIREPQLLLAQQSAPQQDQAPDPTGSQRESPSVDYDRAYDRGYAEGFRHGWVAAEQAAAEQRNESLVTSLLAEGGRHFRNGDYGAAVRSFMLSAELNQGDPTSRLQAAHTLTALQHYNEAFLLLRRAFQLQPKLAYLGLDIRRDYADQAEFAKHIQRLEKDATAAGDNPALWALLGYYRFFSDSRRDAYRALQRAADLDPDERFINGLLNVARLSTPASTSPAPPNRNRN